MSSDKIVCASVSWESAGLGAVELIVQAELRHSPGWKYFPPVIYLIV
jgi:hypothetical protein